jgi:hypothetical protein
MVLPGRLFNDLAVLPGLRLLSGTPLERCLSRASRALFADALGCEPSKVPGCEGLLAAWAAQTHSSITASSDAALEDLPELSSNMLRSIPSPFGAARGARHAGNAMPARGR